jgi:DNA-binding CsgD family transcriptional regulator
MPVREPHTQYDVRPKHGPYALSLWGWSKNETQPRWYLYLLPEGQLLIQQVLDNTPYRLWKILLKNKRACNCTKLAIDKLGEGEVERACQYGLSLAAIGFDDRDREEKVTFLTYAVWKMWGQVSKILWGAYSKKEVKLWSVQLSGNSTFKETLYEIDYDLAIDKNDTTLNRASNTEILNELMTISYLQSRECEMIRLKAAGHSIRDIAKIHHISSARVQQLLARSIDKMRKTREQLQESKQYLT